MLTPWSFLGGSEVKVPVCNVGDLGSIPGSGRFPGEGNGNPLQYSCLDNPMDRGAWWATVHGVLKESDMTERLHFTTPWKEGYDQPRQHIKKLRHYFANKAPYSQGSDLSISHVRI